jgi:hypothetical protein
MAFSFSTAGRPLTVELAVPESCPAGVTVTARFTLADPDNVAITLDPATVSVNTADENGLRAHFTFTPQLAGPYHATAQFEPNLGVAQHDFIVATDHTAETPAFTVSSSGTLGGCPRLEVTAQGGLLCLQAMPTLFGADSGVLQTFGAVQASYADGVLWLSDSTRVSRWIEGALADGGPGFVEKPAGLTTPALANSLLMAVGDTAVAVNSNSVVRIGIVDGGLAVTGTGQFGLFPDVAWTDGDQVLVGNVGGTPCGWSFDAGVMRCLSQPLLQLVAADRAGLWSPEPGLVEGAQVQVLTAFSATGSASLRLPDDVALDLQAAVPWETAPSLVSGDVRYVVGLKQGFTLDAYDGSATRHSITATAVTLESAGALHIYRR